MKMIDKTIFLAKDGVYEMSGDYNVKKISKSLMNHKHNWVYGYDVANEYLVVCQRCNDITCNLVQFHKRKLTLAKSKENR